MCGKYWMDKKVQQLLQNHGDVVKDLYHTVQHWPMADLFALQELLIEPAIWITGDDSISDRERIMVKGDQKLTSVLAGLKCFWLLEQTTATEIVFFDIRHDNFRIKQRMFDLLYRQGVPGAEVADIIEHEEDETVLHNFNKQDPIWDELGKRDISDCTFQWDLINCVQNQQYLIDHMQTVPSSLYLSNIFDYDNDSSWLQDDFAALKSELAVYKRRGGKVWLHNEKGFL